MSSGETVRAYVELCGRGWIPDGERSWWCQVPGWHSECRGIQATSFPDPCRCWCHVSAQVGGSSGEDQPIEPKP